MIRNSPAHLRFHYPSPGILPMLVIGCLLGYLFAGDLFTAPLAQLIIAFAWGFVGSCLFLNWVDVIGQLYTLNTRPIPEDLDLADRGRVGEIVEAMSSMQPVIVRIRNLLNAWAQSCEPRQVMALAAFQSSRWRHVMVSEFVFCFILLLFANFQGGSSTLVWTGIAVLALTVVIRQAVNDKVEQYVESRLLARLPGNLPQTAMTAHELAGALGAQIDKAFHDYIPQPERLTAALKAGIEESNNVIIEQVKNLQQTLLDNQTAIVQTWASASKTTTTELRDVEKALATVVTDLTGGLKHSTEQLNKVLANHAIELEKALSETSTLLKHSQVDGVAQLQGVFDQYAQQLQQSGGNWSGQIKGVLDSHVGMYQQATQNLMVQLEKISGLAADIEKLLHVQESVTAAVQGVSSSEEFRQTLEALRNHIAESDNLIREVAKPRTIKLVESDGELSVQ